MNRVAELDLEVGGGSRWSPYFRRLAARPLPAWAAWYLAMLIPLAVVLLYRLGAAPIAIWDEARLANNAIEMAGKGLSLVSTYGGAADHWNTKPPLLVWLMALSIQLFGASEWAVRLPSVLAAFATASVMFWFCAVQLKRPLAGFVAVLVLLNMPGYLMTHGARSGDYDAMLALWSTSYLVAGFMLAQAARQRQGPLLFACAACVALAFLTKSIQGLIFLPVVVANLAIEGRLPAVLRSRALYLNAALVLVVCGAYYFAREQADPGYFAAVRSNDLGGRFSTVIENHQHGPLWYATQFKFYPWLVPGLLGAFFMARSGAGQQRKVALYFGAASLFYLVVISSASTKVWWYETPLAPLIGILVGVWIDGAWAAKLGQRAALQRTLVRRCAIAGAALIVLDVGMIEQKIGYAQAEAPDKYSLFLRSAAIAQAAPLDLVILHPGYANGQGDPLYVAPTLFYASALRAAGSRVSIQPVSQAVPASATSMVVCGAGLLAQAAAGLSIQAMALSGECGLYRITARTDIVKH